MFAALSLLEAGYTVFANADASGTFDPRAAVNANARMRDAGVYVMPQLAVAADLQRDWRNTPGAAAFLDIFFKYVCFRAKVIPFDFVTDMIQHRIALATSPLSTASLDSTVVPSSTVLSPPAKMRSYPEFAFPFLRLNDNIHYEICPKSYCDAKY